MTLGLWRTFGNDGGILLGVLSEIIRSLEWGKSSHHRIDLCSCANCSDYRSLLNDLRALRSLPPPIYGLGDALAEVGLLLNSASVVGNGRVTEVVISAFVLGGVAPTPSVVRQAVKELAEWTAET